jgi:hypothetical protein
MSNKVDEIFNEIVSQELTESELLFLAQKIILSVATIKNSKEAKNDVLLEERYQFAKERVLKSKAKKLKTLKNTIASYFRNKERSDDQKGKGISQNEVDRIIKRLIGDKHIFINSKDDVEYL